MSAWTARERLIWVVRQQRDGGAWDADGERYRRRVVDGGIEIMIYKQAMRWVWL